jgi:putative DNA primase/helicase
LRSTNRWAGNSFVLPDAVMGADADKVIFQSSEAAHDEHTKAGTMEGWREGVSAMAQGNPC